MKEPDRSVETAATPVLPPAARELTTIDVLGTSFTIRSSEDPVDVERALELYREQLAAVRGAESMRDPLKIAIVAGLNLADALLRQQRTPPSVAANPVAESPSDRIAARLIHELDRALEPDA